MPTSLHSRSPRVVLVEILEPRSSCSMPACPGGRATRVGRLSGFGEGGAGGGGDATVACKPMRRR